MSAERTVLVTGGTRGIGLATALGFAKEGARVVLTHRWESVDADDLKAVFRAHSAAEPTVVVADVANPDDTAELLDGLDAAPDVFISNVCVAGRGTGKLHRRTLRQSLAASATPLVAYLEAMQARFGRIPRHVVAMSSDGHEHFYPGYDYVAASKAMLEASVADLAQRHPESAFFALRARQVDTTSFREMFGADVEVIGRFADFEVDPAEVARAAVALCSGDLDAASGSVVVIDRGATLVDNLVNVAPRLLDLKAPWEVDPVPSGRRRGVLYVDAGLGPPAGGFGDREVMVVGLDEVDGVDPATIPDVVVVGHDWHGGRGAAEDRASALVELMERAEAAGCLPRYGVQIDGGDRPARAISRSLGRYFNGWRLLADTRINYVEGEGARAFAVANALTSGAFDGVRNHVLTVNR